MQPATKSSPKPEKQPKKLFKNAKTKFVSLRNLIFLLDVQNGPANVFRLICYRKNRL